MSPKESSWGGPVIQRLAELAGQQAPVLVAIDGRCGSGKTSLARQIAHALPCNLLHTDDFYLPPVLRAPNWWETPGGNMDFPLLLHSVIKPAKAGKPILYRPFSCKNGGFGPEVSLPPQALTVVEGSYSQHPALCGYYDFRIFLTCDTAAQERRLQDREGAARMADFRQVWIPMEERYFRDCDVRAQSDLVIDTSELFCPRYTISSRRKTQ